MTLSLAMGAQRMAGAARPYSAARIGRDTRFDDVHLHRQDRNPDPQRDGSDPGLDSRRAASTSPAAATTRPCRSTSDPDAAGSRCCESAGPPLRCSSGRAVQRDGSLGGPGRPDGGSDRRTRPAARRRRRMPPRRSSGVSRSIHAAGGRRSSRATRCSSRAPPTRYCRAASTPAMRRPRPSRRWPAAGLRVLAVATRPAAAIAADATADIAERELELLGLLGLEDPPRPTPRTLSPRAAARASGSP